MSAAMFALLTVGFALHSAAESGEPRTVRDAMWIWAHIEGGYDNLWGLPRNSKMTPSEGAKSMGLRNVIMIKYLGKPKPPFNEYAAQFRDMDKVMWSIVGASGETSDKERDHVLDLAAKMPNVTGVFMDDFFFLQPGEVTPHWLAENNVRFPVSLTLTLPEPTAIDRLTLTQSDWKTSDYRSARFAVDLAADEGQYKEAATGVVPNSPGAVVEVALPKTQARAVRIRILGTHDADGAESCGLQRVQLWQGGKAVSSENIKVEASSEYPGHSAKSVLPIKDAEGQGAPAALTVDDIERLRKRLVLKDRKLDLGVTLYTYQLGERVVPHLKHVDVVSLWTWEAQDLEHLEDNFARFQALVPGKRVLLGIYMWDFGTNKPIPLDLMKKQCDLALKWLREGKIEGMIFLATNICDMDIEAVDWARDWIADVGDEPIKK